TFLITDKNKIEIAAAKEILGVSIKIAGKIYSLVDEVCVGDESNFNLSLVLEKEGNAAMFLLDDPGGGKKKNPLNKVFF
ncbi:hypothetical protein DD595_26160, partial [Enterobacter cloacae complex sp. 4DZ3-17B2]